MDSTSFLATCITLAMEDPAHPGYPQELLNQVGPRNMVHSWATDKDDATEMPRWGKIGKHKSRMQAALPHAVGDCRPEILDFSFKFIDQAKVANKPFFRFFNPTRMHIVTHLSPKYEALRNDKMAGLFTKQAWRSSMHLGSVMQQA